MDDRIKRLRTVPLFSGCSDRELRTIATKVEEVDIPAGSVLCREGFSGGEFFIILSGTAEVTSRERPVNTLGEGAFFGEISLVDNGPRTASVVASSDMRCLVLGPAQFRDVLHQNAEIATKVLVAVAQRLRASARLDSD